MGIFDIFKKKENDTPLTRRQTVMNVTDQTFQVQVIQRSFKTAVMVDFWAAWCGPCLRLGPILEKIAEEPNQEFILAKLDTENNPNAAYQFQIQGIPHVKMFRNGAIIGQFTGAIPAPVVRQFVKEMTQADPPTSHLKLGGNLAERLSKAESHLHKGQGFEAFVFLNQFPESSELEQAGSLLPLARFLMDEQDGDALTGQLSLDEAYQKSAESLRSQKPAQALEHLFTALDFSEESDQTYTLDTINALFALLGPDHELTQEYQLKLPQ